MGQKKKSISISVIISLITLVVSFLTSFIFTAFLLSREHIGDINYGLKTTADSFVSFVSIFSFGMSSTFIRFHKKYSDDEENVFSAFNFITSIIGLLALLFGTILFILTINNKILDPSKGVYTHQQVKDFAAILVISISYTALSIILGNSKFYFESTKKIVLVRVVNLVATILYPVISTVFVLMGANMIAVTLIYSVVYLTGFLLFLFVRIKKTKSIEFLKIKKLKHSLIKEIVVFSFFVVLTSSIETFNHSIDKMVLTISLQAASLATVYQLSITLNQVLLTLADIVFAPFLPFIAEDIILNKQEKIQKTYDRVNMLLLLISFLIFTGFATCGKKFVYIWVGDGKEIVYYFTTILFSLWPLYGMVKFSNSIQRLYAKHYKSSFLYLISFIIHIGITFSFVKVIGMWACIAGTAVGNIFLGISFVIYNKKVLKINQNIYIKNLLKLSLCSLATICLSFLFSYLLDTNLSFLSNINLMLIEGLISVIIFFVFIAIAYWKKTRDLVLKCFNDSYSFQKYGRLSTITLLKNKLYTLRNKITNFFPIILIIYFIFNFASYYLGGLEFISFIVNSSVFIYSSKIISYFVMISYGVLFIISNGCKIEFKNIIIFVSVFIVSVLSSIVIPKTISFITVNEYNLSILTTFSLGLFDLIVGNINWLIDLTIMFFYLYIFRQAAKKKNLIVFMRFIVVFTIIECLYSFIFQYEDYLYFFLKAGGDSSFNGYSTNLSATFSSKNGFGFLLFQSLIASLFLVIYDSKINMKLYIAAFIIFNIVNIFSLCKTSIIASLIFNLIIFGYWLNKQRKNNSKRFLNITLCATILIFLISFCFTPIMRQIPFINSAVEKIEKMFFVSGSATIRSRIILWEYALKLVKGPYLILGYGKIASSYFLNISSNFTTLSFHNGILDILCSFGVFVVALYFYGIGYCYIKSTCFENKKIKKILIIAIIAATLLYGMTEEVYLLISSSSTMLVPNIILSLSEDKICKNELGGKNHVEINI